MSDANSTEPMAPEDYNLGLHIGGLFANMAASGLGGKAHTHFLHLHVDLVPATVSTTKAPTNQNTINIFAVLYSPLSSPAHPLQLDLLLAQDHL